MRRRRLSKLVFMLAISSICAGCLNDAPQDRELYVGCWQSESRHTHLIDEFLDLDADGSFEHIIHFQDQDIRTEKGAWRIVLVNEEVYVVFNGLIPTYARFGECNPRVNCARTSELVANTSVSFGGDLRMHLHPDFGYRFSRVGELCDTADSS